MFEVAKSDDGNVCLGRELREGNKSDQGTRGGRCDQETDNNKNEVWNIAQVEWANVWCQADKTLKGTSRANAEGRRFRIIQQAELAKALISQSPIL